MATSSTGGEITRIGFEKSNYIRLVVNKSACGGVLKQALYTPLSPTPPPEQNKRCSLYECYLRNVPSEDM